MAPRTANNIKALLQEYLSLYPQEVARLLEDRPVAEVIPLLESVPAPRLVSLLDRMMAEPAALLLSAMSEERAKVVLTELEPARSSVILSRMEPPQRGPLLGLMEERERKEVQLLMSYPADSAGGLMDPQVMTFRPENTARQALSKIRSSRRRILDVCTIDEEGKLTGVVPIQELALAPPGTRMQELIRGVSPSVHALASREEVVDLLATSRATSLPVVDLEGKLLGIIRHGALMTAAQEEASVDIQTMVGASREERALSTVWFAVRKRLPWLQINLATAFLAASVVGIFESTIAQFTALAVLLPVVAGQSGNTGAQALAVTMRGLALREIRMRHTLRVSLKEMTVGLINGVAVAIVTSLGVLVWSRSVGLSLVIGTAMVISMVIAGLSGSMIPMALAAVGQDPAQSSSIVLTTVTDVVGFFSFLGLASLFAALL